MIFRTLKWLIKIFLTMATFYIFIFFNDYMVQLIVFITFMSISYFSWAAVWVNMAPDN